MKIWLTILPLAFHLLACGGDDNSAAVENTTAPTVNSGGPTTTEDTFGDDTPDVMTVDSVVSRTAETIVEYADSQARIVLLDINNKLFSGTISDAERGCLMDSETNEAVIEVMCDGVYFLRYGEVLMVSARSRDSEQGRADGNATCRSGLMNGTTADCEIDRIYMTDSSLGLTYSYSQSAQQSPVITVTSEFESLSCSMTVAQGSLDAPNSNGCFELIEQFATTIESRSTDLLDDISPAGQIITEYADIQARIVMLNINQQVRSGSISDSTRNCLADTITNEAVIEANCQNGYPIPFGEVFSISARSRDFEQSFQDDNAACRNSLANNNTAECEINGIVLTDNSLGLTYDYSRPDRQDPGIVVTRNSDSLNCFLSYEFGSFDSPNTNGCYELIEEFANAIQTRRSIAARAAFDRASTETLAITN